MLTRDEHFKLKDTSRHIQTEREGMKKDIPCKHKGKERRGNNTHYQTIQTLKQRL